MRNLAIWSVLAAASLFGAWAVARAPSRPSGERPTIFALRPAELRTLRFVHGPMELAFERRTDEAGDRALWLTLSAAGRKPLSFRANRAAERLFEHMAPLRAKRALGMLSPAEQREAGLTDGRDAIFVGSQRLRVAPPAAHASERVVITDQGAAYAIDAELVPVVELAPRELFETRLHAFRAAEVDDVSIEPSALGREQAMTLQTALAPSDDATFAPDLVIRYLERGRTLGFLEISGHGTNCRGRSERSITPVVLPAESCPP